VPKQSTEEALVRIAGATTIVNAARIVAKRCHFDFPELAFMPDEKGPPSSQQLLNGDQKVSHALTRRCGSRRNTLRMSKPRQRTYHD
jgi:hypothetical protein